MVNLRGMRIPCGPYTLFYDDGEFKLGKDGIGMDYYQLEEMAIAINHALNMVDDNDSVGP